MPALSVPVGNGGTFGTSWQIVCKRNEDEKVLSIARQLINEAQ